MGGWGRGPGLEGCLKKKTWQNLATVGMGIKKRWNQREPGVLAQKTRPVAVAFGKAEKQDLGGAHSVGVIFGEQPGQPGGSTWGPRSAAEQTTPGPWKPRSHSE